MEHVSPMVIPVQQQIFRNFLNIQQQPRLLINQPSLPFPHPSFPLSIPKSLLQPTPIANGRPIRIYHEGIYHEGIKVNIGPNVGPCSNLIKSFLSLCASNPKIIGLDLEWVKNKNVSLLQIAHGKSILLIRLHLLKTIPAELTQLLANSEIIKCGVGIEKDVNLLLTQYGIKTNGWVELNDFLSIQCEENHKRHFMSLHKLYQTCFNVSMKWKHVSITTSNWESRRLSPEQIHYAADDALAGYQIMMHLIQLRYGSIDKNHFEDLNAVGLINNFESSDVNVTIGYKTVKQNNQTEEQKLENIKDVIEKEWSIQQRIYYLGGLKERKRLAIMKNDQDSAKKYEYKIKVISDTIPWRYRNCNYTEDNNNYNNITCKCPKCATFNKVGSEVCPECGCKQEIKSEKQNITDEHESLLLKISELLQRNNQIKDKINLEQQIPVQNDFAIRPVGRRDQDSMEQEKVKMKLSVQYRNHL